MRRHRHRLSQDVEIFINDPQFSGYLTPRLNPTAEALTSNYVEDSRFVKLSFPEGGNRFCGLGAADREGRGVGNAFWPAVSRGDHDGNCRKEVLASGQ